MGLTAVGVGLRAGAPLLAAVFAVQVVLVIIDDDPNDAWVLLLLAGLVASFARAGSAAARQGGARPIRAGGAAGLAVFVAWLPLRLLVALVGDSDNPFAGLGAGLALAVLVSLTAALLTAQRRSEPTG